MPLRCSLWVCFEMNEGQVVCVYVHIYIEVACEHKCIGSKFVPHGHQHWKYLFGNW